jgi:hypothetical protein
MFFDYLAVWVLLVVALALVSAHHRRSRNSPRDGRESLDENGSEKLSACLRFHSVIACIFGMES